MIDLYIYYKVRAFNAEALQARVRAMQVQLCSLYGVVAQLKRRPKMVDAQDGLQTWMEVYTGTTDSFAASLAGAERDAGLLGLIEGQRHTEMFMTMMDIMDTPPCA